MIKLDKNPDIINGVQTFEGKFWALFFFTVAFLFNPFLPLYGSLAVIITLGLMSFFPDKRRLILLLGTMFFWFQCTGFEWGAVQNYATLHKINFSDSSWLYIQTICLVVSVLLSALYTLFAKRLKLKHPIILFFAFIAILMWSADYLPISAKQHVYLWSLLVVFTRYSWFLGYTLLDRSPQSNKSLLMQFGHYLPFWGGGSNVPFPKGAAYLNKIEAKSSEELAITQLKAIKLVYWALILYAGYTVLTEAQIYLHIPDLATSLHNCAHNNCPIWYMAWIIMILNFFKTILGLAVWGHFTVAAIRMAGFRALRNTYKPLQSKTIAEFWNRYYFYFKELLVEFFFYPTYFRFFKKHPRIRIFFATFMAACVGNVIYHYVEFIQYPIKYGPWQALKDFYVYMFYAAILGLAIGISQIRQMKKKPTGFKSKYLAPIIVVGFYCLLSPFNHAYGTFDIHTNFIFMKSLFT